MQGLETRVSARDVRQFEGDALVVGVFSDDEALQGPAAALDESLAGVITTLRASGEISGATDETTLLHTLGKIEPTRVLIIGLGARSRCTPDRIRRAAAIGCRMLRKVGARHIGLALAWVESGVNLAQAARAATEGALLGLYEFTSYKSSKSNQVGKGAQISDRDGQVSLNSHNGAHESADLKSGPDGQDERTGQTGDLPVRRRLTTITIIGRGREPALRAAVARGRIIAEGANFARDLGNEPPNILTPTELAERARRMAQEVGLECDIYGPDWMRQQGMGALLGVNQGSAQEPRFIVLRYHGGTDATPGLGLLGKGITFDSGGVSIKTADGMREMKIDMAGGASVIGAMRAIAQLRPAINVTGIIPTTENMPDGGAYRPGDILRASNGKTIEILNTDAEGRLILADALSYAVKQRLSPLIDIATLTGAITTALGSVRAGLFSNDEALQRIVQQAADAAGERVWPMPMDDEYGDLIRSEIADLKQTSGGRAAGSIAAAKVLNHFVGATPWAHLDIAAMALRDRRTAESEPGATGFGVRLFVELATLLAAQQPAGAQAQPAHA
ncbi:MAG TPA: leucyl aminopeptidase [Ktedonobacterales bacterium]|nr:leucyl aminopeptidase [Ktedonobacterales bacterium]